MFRIVIGLRCFLPPYPHTLALYQVSVRQTRCLPLTSFRFHLAMDTLVSLAIRFPLSGLVGDLHPLDNAHAEHTKKPRWFTSTRHILKSFFFFHAFEWSSVLFAIHKLSIETTFSPNTCFWIKDLTPLAHHSISVAIATWGICCHIQSLPVLFGD